MSPDLFYANPLPELADTIVNGIRINNAAYISKDPSKQYVRMTL
jgi:hypothetical protein